LKCRESILTKFKIKEKVKSDKAEAQAGQSRADFISNYAIALKESRQAIYYWLRLLKKAGMYGDWDALIQEAGEIARIIGAIIVNTKNNPHCR
jgi:four helix bundle protein